MSFLYDIVWFQPAFQTEALKLIRKLPIEEINARFLHDLHGLRVWNPVPIPDADGKPSPLSGICMVRNFHASNFVAPSAVKTGVLVIHKFLSELKVIRPGLVGGNLLPDWFDQETVKLEAISHKDAEVGHIAKIKLERENFKSEKSSELQDLIARWCITIGLLARVQNPSKLNVEEATDLGIAMKMMGERELLNLQDWVVAQGYTNEIPELRLSDDPIREAAEAQAAYTLPNIVRKAR